MNILLSTCSQGLLYGILALGVYITFRILNFADMTAEGSLTLGGSICAVLISNDVHPIFSTVLAGLLGSFAGLITAFLHTKLKIQDILAGILTMISLYSINLRIMRGNSNVSLLGKDTIFSESRIVIFLIGFAICASLLLILNLFFKTQIGLSIRATGDNEQMMRALGANTNLKKTIALMISNFLCATSGALISQFQGYTDVNMGTGSIVIALASIVIGEAILKNNSFLFKLIAVVLGSISYRFIIVVVLSLGMNPSDLKLFTSIVAAILLALPNIRKTIMRGFKNAKN